MLLLIFEFKTQSLVFFFQLRESLSYRCHHLNDLVLGVAGSDVLLAVPVEAFNPDCDDPLDELAVIRRCELFKVLIRV